jgi:hypothetical protein
VSFGGDDRPPGARGLIRFAERVLWSLERWLGGVMVPSLNSSVALESLWVTGEGRWPCFNSGEALRSERRGFLGSTVSPWDCCTGGWVSSEWSEMQWGVNVLDRA